MLQAEQDWLTTAIGGRIVEFYAAIGVDLPDRGGTEASVRCFANATAHNRDDRSPSCSVNLLTGLWHCHACMQSGNPYLAALAMGFTERRARDLTRSHGLFLEGVPREKPRLPTEKQLRKWRNALMDSPAILRRLRKLKGWTPQAIHRCGLGWDGERLTFAIRQQKQLKLVGLVRYLPGAEKKMIALPGSKRGLFPAPEVLSTRRPLFVVEGEPAAVSVRSTGHQAVAIPGAASWRGEFMQRLLGYQLVCLPDCDTPGRDLMQRVFSVLPNVRVVDVEPGRNDGFDVGDMVAEANLEGGIWQMTRWLENLL